MSDVAVKWNTLSIQDWSDIYMRIPKSNIVQTYAYAKAMRVVHFQNTRFGAIYFQDEIVGLVQAQELSLLGGLVHRLFIDRGPIWFDVAYDEMFWAYIAKTYPKRFGRKRRFIPEVSVNDLSDHAFEASKFKKTGDGYQTFWFDLNRTTDEMRKAMKGNWRRSLDRGLREADDVGLECFIDDKSLGLERFLSHYSVDRQDKQYAGAHPKFIRAMERFKSKTEHSFIITAKYKGEVCAQMYFFIHGCAATYQMAWGNAQARESFANYILLWRAILHLKSQGIEWLDLGGIHPTHAKGVTRFKKGLGGDRFETPGIFR